MNPALDKNGNKILPGRLALNNDGRCFVIEKLDLYNGDEIVLLKPLKEEYLFPIGLKWSHQPHNELTMLSEHEALIFILKNE